MKKKAAALILAVFLSVSSLQLSTIPCNGKITLDDISQMEQSLKDVQDKIEENEKALNEVKNEQSFTESAINYSLSLINGYTEYCNILSGLIAEYESEIQALSLDIAVLQEEFDGIYDIYLKRLGYMREEESISFLQLLFDSDSLIDLMVSIERAKEAIRYDKELMKEINGKKAVIEARLMAKKALQEGKIQQIENYESLKLNIMNRIEELKKYLIELDEDIADILSEKDLFEQMEEDADKEIQNLIDKYISENPKVPSYGMGETIHWPLDDKYTYISSYYGYRTHPITGEKYSFHQAIDIPASEGENIYAIHSGIVITATYHSSYGNYVIIDHGKTGSGGNHLYSLYAHATKLNVEEGQEVAIGDVIAFVGDTGSAKGDHLHIEIRVGSSAKDPLKYLTIPK